MTFGADAIGGAIRPPPPMAMRKLVERCPSRCLIPDDFLQQLNEPIFASRRLLQPQYKSALPQTPVVGFRGREGKGKQVKDG